MSTHIHVDVGDEVVVTRVPVRRVPGVVNTGGVPFIIPHTHTHAHTRTHTHAHTHAHTHTHTHTLIHTFPPQARRLVVWVRH